MILLTCSTHEFNNRICLHLQQAPSVFSRITSGVPSRVCRTPKDFELLLRVEVMNEKNVFLCLETVFDVRFISFCSPKNDLNGV